MAERLKSCRLARFDVVVLAKSRVPISDYVGGIKRHRYLWFNVFLKSMFNRLHHIFCGSTGDWCTIFEPYPNDGLYNLYILRDIESKIPETSGCKTSAFLV